MRAREFLQGSVRSNSRADCVGQCDGAQVAAAAHARSSLLTIHVCPFRRRKLPLGRERIPQNGSVAEECSTAHRAPQLAFRHSLLSDNPDTTACSYAPRNLDRPLWQPRPAIQLRRDRAIKCCVIFEFCKARQAPDLVAPDSYLGIPPFRDTTLCRAAAFAIRDAPLCRLRSRGGGPGFRLRPRRYAFSVPELTR